MVLDRKVRRELDFGGEQESMEVTIEEVSGEDAELPDAKKQTLSGVVQWSLVRVMSGFSDQGTRRLGGL